MELMFGFEKDEDGSEERWDQRIEEWENEVPKYEEYPAHLIPIVQTPKTFRLGKHYVWWLIHNLVAHPLIGIAPVKPFFQFHDWTSRKMHP